MGTAQKLRSLTISADQMKLKLWFSIMLKRNICLTRLVKEGLSVKKYKFAVLKKPKKGQYLDFKGDNMLLFHGFRLGNSHQSESK